MQMSCDQGSLNTIVRARVQMYKGHELTTGQWPAAHRQQGFLYGPLNSPCKISSDGNTLATESHRTGIRV